MKLPINERLAASEKLGTTAPLLSSRKLRLILCISVVIGLLGIIGATLYTHRADKAELTPEIVPARISQSVPFHVYYPNPTSLPAGYTLDQNSFSANGQAIVYSISYATGKKIAFTVQSKPSDEELKTFYANQLPLRNEVKVPIGVAVIGVVNGQTFASIPVKKTWILITAPHDIDQEQFRKVLHALQQ